MGFFAFLEWIRIRIQNPDPRQWLDWIRTRIQNSVRTCEVPFLTRYEDVGMIITITIMPHLEDSSKFINRYRKRGKVKALHKGLFKWPLFLHRFFFIRQYNFCLQNVREYFSQFGDVAEVMVMKDPATRRSRGFGFITFCTPNRWVGGGGNFSPVLRIHVILVWIRIRGSMPLTNGFGCGSCYFHHWPSRHHQKLI